MVTKTPTRHRGIGSRFGLVEHPEGEWSGWSSSARERLRRGPLLDEVTQKLLDEERIALGLVDPGRSVLRQLG
jgi:hypothetical protein